MEEDLVFFLLSFWFSVCLSLSIFTVTLIQQNDARATESNPNFPSRFTALLGSCLETLRLGVKAQTGPSVLNWDYTTIKIRMDDSFLPMICTPLPLIFTPFTFFFLWNDCDNVV